MPKGNPQRLNFKLYAWDAKANKGYGQWRYIIPDATSQYLGGVYLSDAVDGTDDQDTGVTAATPLAVSKVRDEIGNQINTLKNDLGSSAFLDAWTITDGSKVVTTDKNYDTQSGQNIVFHKKESTKPYDYRLNSSDNGLSLLDSDGNKAIISANVDGKFITPRNINLEGTGISGIGSFDGGSDTIIDTKLDFYTMDDTSWNKQKIVSINHGDAYIGRSLAFSEQNSKTSYGDMILTYRNHELYLSDYVGVDDNGEDKYKTGGTLKANIDGHFITPRKIFLSGDASGVTNFDGSEDTEIDTTINNNTITLAKLNEEVGTVTINKNQPEDEHIKIWVDDDYVCEPVKSAIITKINANNNTARLNVELQSSTMQKSISVQYVKGIDETKILKEVTATPGTTKYIIDFESPFTITKDLENMKKLFESQIVVFTHLGNYYPEIDERKPIQAFRMALEDRDIHGMPYRSLSSTVTLDINKVSTSDYPTPSSAVIEKTNDNKYVAKVIIPTKEQAEEVTILPLTGTTNNVDLSLEYGDSINISEGKEVENGFEYTIPITSYSSQSSYVAFTCATDYNPAYPLNQEGADENHNKAGDVISVTKPSS